ncbi:hypothetical protein HII31_12602 [Pseudocercospora fuligena]|uniref:Uncharacterized protein n=1 Tax=Pseudocercospora fuligena TaxID=685502 RepID=A0A8H6R6C0_9PEZI|nr:hypothetical protein HII31_12602 [Pseudocercospora fuligena]
MDRDRRRERDFPPEDQYMGGRGQSYRPGNHAPRDRERDRSPPRLGGDSYRARSPPRRPNYLEADTYRAPRGRSRSPPRRDDDRLPLRRDDDRAPLRRDDDRLPPRRDDDRLPPRRDDFRRRSPSPPRYRDERQGIPRGGDSYRGRPRSPPPRREDLPRDDLFRREPVRDERDYRDARDYRDDRDRSYAPVARSPAPSAAARYRDRSAVPLKRVREPSPISSRGRRTPPPAKRERLASPPRGRYDDYPPSRGVTPPRRRFSPERPREREAYSPTTRGATRGYRLRSRSPLTRNERVDPRNVDDWRRPRSPVRDTRQDYLSREESAVNSAVTSRHTSPPVHPSRMSHLPSEMPIRASPRDPYDDREPYRAGDLEDREIREYETPVKRDAYDDRGYSNGREREVPPPREPRREDDAPVPAARAPPTGPSSQRGPATSMAPPTGPAATPQGPRAGGPPMGPRGGMSGRGDFSSRGRGGFGGDFAPRGRGGFSSFRGGRGGAPPAGPSGFAGNRSVSETFNPPSGPGGQPPSGPRNSFSQASPPLGPASFSRQPSSSTAPTGPRSQRFEPTNGTTAAMPDAPTGPRAGRRPTEHSINSMTVPTGPSGNSSASRVHPALADLPKIVDGGQKMEPVVDRSKLNKLEDEAERLRKQIEDKETKKRKSLREWEKMSRETEAAALRSELAEEALRSINGEAEHMAAF